MKENKRWIRMKKKEVCTELKIKLIKIITLQLLMVFGYTLSALKNKTNQIATI